ncbi:MAG: response regulator transcription factor [Verrucomicrobia bacterium]|nr:response regulator transcription factor [Verrucomicrobiota bacterium]
MVLLDFGLPGIKGGAAVHWVKTALPSCRVLVVTGIPINHVVFEALEAGADGFLDKEGITAKVLLGEIRAAHEGRAPLSDRARRLVLEKLQAERPNLAEWNKLTEREKEVASLLKRGLPDKEIARALNISVNTVRIHFSHIFSKLEARDRYEIQFNYGAFAKGGVRFERIRSLPIEFKMAMGIADFQL